MVVLLTTASLLTPLGMAEGGKVYGNSEIPTNLSQVWNHNTGYHAFLTHRYNLGFYRVKSKRKGYGQYRSICSGNKFPSYCKCRH